uniref:Uncharacterized protein n=1 Tax=Hanusia phi TaxID=3032 RepID=A0A7S0F426_9CRYP
MIRSMSERLSSMEAEKEAMETRLREKVRKLENQLFEAKQKEAELLARLNVMEKFAVLPHVKQNNLQVSAMIDEMLSTTEMNFRLANQVDLLRSAAEEAIQAADCNSPTAQGSLHAPVDQEEREDALNNLSEIEEQLLLLQSQLENDELGRSSDNLSDSFISKGENLHEELRKTKAQLAEMQLVKEISELHHKEIESLKLELQKLYDLLNKKMVDDGNKNSLQDLWNMLKSVMNQNSQLSQEMRNMQASLTLKKYESLVQAHPTLQPAPSAGRDASAKKYHNSRSNNQERLDRRYLTVGQTQGESGKSLIMNSTWHGRISEDSLRSSGKSDDTNLHAEFLALKIHNAALLRRM